MRYKNKFGDLGNNFYIIVHVLGYFDDAEEDTMPHMLTPLSWEIMKTFLMNESNCLAKKYFNRICIHGSRKRASIIVSTV
mgnify:CR=1 FL=1